MRWLAAQGRGLDAGVAKVPIVPAAALFDLSTGDPTAYPDAESGWAACEAATTAPVPEGPVGAGTGATVSKLTGLADAVPAGLGSAVVRTPDGVRVGALAAVNALGNIVDPTTGAPLTGGASITRLAPPRFSSTTLVVVATEAHLTQAGCTALARSAHVGLARAIRPVHTPYDGDTVFVLSTGRARAEPVGLAETAARAVADAVVRAVARDR
jgi:L-aminopeptidase/D-esterase-like protein